MKYRHEEKYLVSEADLCALQIRLRALMQRDPHARENGSYLIRSVYFDDGEQNFWRENEMGVSPRQKWRIRAYNMDAGMLRLECKHKAGHLTAKQSAVCPRDLAKALIGTGGGDGVAGTEADAGDDLLQTFFAIRKARELRPAVIVQYERTPLVYAPGNVRVTFDRNIIASCDFDRFFDPVLRRRPILPTGAHILEVKYDEFLPRAIADAVQMRDLRRITFSKYALCRKQFML